ncbi:MAG: hypothetical protein QOE32_4860 [Pseudonocardiales bacterium]|nr:hypothetical protein [Pseudonocardiales bacterium]
MTLASGTEDEFWKVQERMGPVAASQPGFQAVIGGPIANSSWMYFCGKFATPEDMDEWYRSRRHQPVMRKAHTTWFDAFYIRKWRLPADDEELAGPLFCEIAIVPPAALDSSVVDAVVDSLTEALPSTTHCRSRRCPGSSSRSRSSSSARSRSSLGSPRSATCCSRTGAAPTSSMPGWTPPNARPSALSAR